MEQAPKKIKVLDLPNNTDARTILLEIPEDCNQIMDTKFKEAYFVAFHNNGTGLFITNKPKSDTSGVPLYPIYPSVDNPLRNWNVISYKIKPDGNDKH